MDRVHGEPGPMTGGVGGGFEGSPVTGNARSPGSSACTGGSRGRQDRTVQNDQAMVANDPARRCSLLFRIGQMVSMSRTVVADFAHLQLVAGSDSGPFRSL